jgi:predicted Zn-dependent protease with MMP-like domain
MEMTSAALSGKSPGASGSHPIQTTLYALVEAVMEEVEPEEETLVTQVVMGLLGKAGAH